VRGGEETGGDRDDGLEGRLSLDRLLLRRDLRPLDAITVPTGRISLKEESLDCQRTDRIRGEGSSQRRTNIKESTKAGPK